MAQDSSYGLSPVAILADSDPLESGSNFPHEHFLRMRILYVTEVLLPRNAIRRRFLARFHEEVKDKVKVTFDRNRSLEYLEGFLENPAKIEAAWLSQDPEKAGFFAIAIDELHQLNAKGVETTSDDEDTSGEKVFPGPFRIKPPGETGESPAVALARAKWNMTTPSKQHHSNVPNYLQHTTELEPEGLSSFDDESTQATPSTEVRSEHSALDSTIARAKNAFDRKNYIPKDEQIVNVCLETMLIALSWTLGYRNRISAERRAFHIPKDDTSHLYQAQVDGLIKGDGVRIPIAFMEVKKHLRGTNQAVRRQIGAQMSGFIYAHDKDLPASTYIYPFFDSRCLLTSLRDLVQKIIDQCGWSLWMVMKLTST